MRKSREELNYIHKKHCKELKEIRAKIAKDLGIDLKQRECTYEGYCSGTCPKCKSEEMRLNAAILKKQLEESDMKRKVVAAGLTTVAALSLTGCNSPETEVLEGDTTLLIEDEYIDGNMDNAELEGVFATEYETECETEFETECETEFETECETEYATECETECETEYATEYETECETESETEYLVLEGDVVYEGTETSGAGN